MLAGLALCLAGPLAATASAQFRSVTAPAQLPVSTGTLAPPTSPAAVAGCVLVTHKVDLSWTATTSGFATGYAVYRRPSSGGSFSQIATVNGVATTRYTDSAVVAATKYEYVVDAVRGGWSARSAAVAVTTRSLCLL